MSLSMFKASLQNIQSMSKTPGLPKTPKFANIAKFL